MEISRVPNKLKKYRHCAGYSQKKLARLLGLSDTSLISRWEHGAALPNMRYAFCLSRLYDTLPHVLFEGLWNQFDSRASLLAQDEPNTSNESMDI